MKNPLIALRGHSHKRTILCFSADTALPLDEYPSPNCKSMLLRPNKSLSLFF